MGARACVTADSLQERGRKTNYKAVTRSKKHSNLGPFSVGENRLRGHQFYTEENNC